MSDRPGDRDALTREIAELLARLDGAGGGIRLSPEQHALGTRPAGTDEPGPRAFPRIERLEFGLMFFSAPSEDGAQPGLYDLVRQAAAAADRLGLTALWVPERHFHRFGGPYPSPAVLAAALAGVTERIRLRAGSITLPLNHPVRVVEAWSMIDHLSGGRVELGFGSGWSPNDFVLSPDNFETRKSVFRERIDQVRRLWRGEGVPFVNGLGESVPVRVYPSPLQAEPPVWVAATGNPETFEWAGANDCHVLTMLLGTSLTDIAARIRVYRQARSAAGLDPAGGRVALMMHTLVHGDEQRAMDAIREPFTRYVRDALDAQRHATAEGRELDPGQREKMVAYATERYTRTAALFGAPDSCMGLLDQVADAGVNEIACLIDFGPEPDLVLEGLPHLAELGEHWNARRTRPPAPSPPLEAAAGPAEGADPVPIAVIGMSGVFPGSPDIHALADSLRANSSALGPAPAGRFRHRDPGLTRGGFIDGIDMFDPAPFRIAPVEAAAMDPHQRLLLTLARRCLLDAGILPETLRGTAAGVFAALYSDSHNARERPAYGDPDPLEATGRVHSMGPNRISHVFDLTGPSELVATACSSGLVAVHRAVRSLRSGECKLALVCGASLLLSDRESRALRALGVLSPEDQCIPFDTRASGQCRGEGGVALLLRPLDAALAAGDPVHAVILGSATNHGGAASGSLLLPNANRQAACIRDALADARSPLGSIGYIEAHGAGAAAGDRAELAALAELWRGSPEPPPPNPIAVASGKPATGSLDAAGSLAGLVRAATAVRDGLLPALAAGGEPGEDNPLDGSPFYLNRSPGPWPIAPASRRRRAGVHAYGLGGVNAHVVLEAPPEGSRPGPVSARAEPILISARSRDALLATARHLARHLRRPGIPALGHIAHTLRVGRPVESHWWWTVAGSTPDLIERLEALAEGREPSPPSPVAPNLEATVAALAAAGSPRSVRAALGRIPALPGARRVSLPGALEAPLHFPLDRAGSAPEAIAGEPTGTDASPVADFYDYVTRDSQAAYQETYLTLAPFPEPLAGFSWTRTMQDPAAHPQHSALLLQRQREMRSVAYAEVDLASVSRVLDIGCGLGTDLIELALCHPGLEGQGYTLSGGQARTANARIAARGLARRLRVEQRDSSKAPFPGRFDLVIGFEVAHHVADKDGLFANIAAALEPAGDLVLADTVAGTIAPVDLPELGSHTLPRADYAALFARHGLLIRSCCDLSREIANFLLDPELDGMLADEAGIAAETGRSRAYPLAAAVQRSWDAFGAALREGLMHYVLVHARPAPPGLDPLAVNLRQMEAS